MCSIHGGYLSKNCRVRQFHEPSRGLRNLVRTFIYEKKKNINTLCRIDKMVL